MRRWRSSDGATWSSSAGLPRSTSYWVTNPLALSARNTLWPNSTGARTLPRLIRSVCEDRIDLIRRRHLFAIEHTAARLVDDARAERAIMRDLVAQGLDVQRREQVLASHPSGIVKRRP